ncbi:MAG: LptF/LptG family permease [Candidatus Muiribacteriaceae bacterium]
MVKILDKYIFKSLFAPFLFGVFSFFIIMAIDPIYSAAQYIIAKQKPLDLVMRWFFYKLFATDLIFVFPMSVLLSTLITMGRYSSLSEITAMKSGGIPFYRTMVPILIFALVVTVLTFVVYEKVVPYAIEQEELYNKYKLLNLPRHITKENVFLRESETSFLFIRKINFYNRLFNNLMIYYIEDGILTETLGAKEGYLKKDEEIWVLKNGSINHFGEDGLVDSVERFKLKEISLNNSFREIQNFDKEDPNAMTFMELFRKIKSLSKHGVLNLDKYLVALYQKTAMPFSCMIFAFIGAAMGTTTKRSGTFANLGLSVILIFIYYVLFSFLKSYGVAGKMSPIFATWLPNIIFAAFGIFLVTKVKN